METETSLFAVIVVLLFCFVLLSFFVICLLMSVGHMYSARPVFQIMETTTWPTSSFRFFSMKVSLQFYLVATEPKGYCTLVNSLYLLCMTI